MEFANKREHTLWLIEQGGATNKSIEETVGISNKSRGTIFAPASPHGQVSHG